MHPKTKTVAEHMKRFGLLLLGRAVVESTFNEMCRPYAHAMAVGHAAHGAEIIIKAKIAQEHPLLIFEGLPRSRTAADTLTVAELFEHGRTWMYAELPERLWAVTGVRLRHSDAFLAFGRLRNIITHFAVPERDLAGDTLEFVFNVMEPLVNSFWGHSIIPYSKEYDDAVVQYLPERLVRLGIKISPRLRNELGFDEQQEAEFRRRLEGQRREQMRRPPPEDVKGRAAKKRIKR